MNKKQKHIGTMLYSSIPDPEYVNFWIIFYTYMLWGEKQVTSNIIITLWMASLDIIFYFCWELERAVKISGAW